MAVFIIAEIGVNHNGDVNVAEELVRTAKQCGADAVKFQSFDSSELVSPSAKKAAYQVKGSGAGSQLEMLRKLELSKADHFRLKETCDRVGIEFMSTPFNSAFASFLVDVGIKRIKVPSGEITNYLFLKQLARLGLPMILSTGMATMDEVRAARDLIGREWAATFPTFSLDEYLTILHCTSSYPAEMKDLNLRAILSLHDELGVPVGYSDHSMGSIASFTAVAFGAQVIEKHITFDRTQSGPDHSASMEPSEFADMVRQIRDLETALGSGLKVPVDGELEMLEVARRGIKSTRFLPAGTVISSKDIVSLRPAVGITAEHFEALIGRQVVTDIASGAAINWSDLANEGFS